MTFIKITETQNFNPEIYIQLQNKKMSFIFSCQNTLLLNYYEHPAILSGTKDHKAENFADILNALGHLFAHELVKFLGTKIEGGLFEVVEVSAQLMLDHQLNSTDILIDDIAPAKLYATSSTMNIINQHILSKTILTQINKVTGHPVFTKQLKIDEIYHVSLKDNIRTLQNRFQFLKCSYELENNVLDFYFPEKIVRHFCSLVIKNTNAKSLVFNMLLGKIFAELFLDYLCANAHVFAKIKSVEVQYVKDKEFLEFNLNSNVHNFEFFVDIKNKLFLIKMLTAMNFTKTPESLAQDNKPNFNHLSLPFSVELGVTYLNQTEYKNLTEGDIIVFDKTCLSTETMNVDKCVINLNGLNLVASLHDDSCQVTHSTKDW